MLVSGLVVPVLLVKGVRLLSLDMRHTMPREHRETGRRQT